MQLHVASERGGRFGAGDKDTPRPCACEIPSFAVNSQFL